ncbi:uncharacterized protein LOC144478008 [Augochlora pura]
MVALCEVSDVHRKLGFNFVGDSVSIVETGDSDEWVRVLADVVSGDECNNVCRDKFNVGFKVLKSGSGGSAPDMCTVGENRPETGFVKYEPETLFYFRATRYEGVYGSCCFFGFIYPVEYCWSPAEFVIENYS